MSKPVESLQNISESAKFCLKLKFSVKYEITYIMCNCVRPCVSQKQVTSGIDNFAVCFFVLIMKNNPCKWNKQIN